MEVDSSRHVADRRLLARDMALLEALDEHTNVRHAMLAAASLDPRTAQAAQKAYAAAERREQFSAESGSLAGEGTLRAAQEMIMYHKAVGVERAETLEVEAFRQRRTFLWCRREGGSRGLLSEAGNAHWTRELVDRCAGHRRSGASRAKRMRRREQQRASEREKLHFRVGR